MENTRTYLIRYKQKCWGEIIESSYTKQCSYDELQMAVNCLYDDPHVIDVETKDITVCEVNQC